MLGWTDTTIATDKVWCCTSLSCILTHQTKHQEAWFQSTGAGSLHTTRCPLPNKNCFFSESQLQRDACYILVHFIFYRSFLSSWDCTYVHFIQCTCNHYIWTTYRNIKLYASQHITDTNVLDHISVKKVSRSIPSARNIAGAAYTIPTDIDA